MVGESFHQSGCRGEDDDHIRLGATVQNCRAFSLNAAASRKKVDRILTTFKLRLRAYSVPDVQNLFKRNSALKHVPQTLHHLLTTSNRVRCSGFCPGQQKAGSATKDCSESTVRERAGNLDS